MIAGSAKGTKLYGARGMRIRPVIDRVKESLFALLSDRVEGALVLDLFAGIGSLGIEALSRGAARADFVEQHRATAEALKRNLERTHLADRARVYVSRLPAGLTRARVPYRLIFMDPPFRIDTRLLEELFRLISGKGLLEPDGLLVYRHSPHSFYEPPRDRWLLAQQRDYGDSILSVFVAAGPEEDEV